MATDFYPQEEGAVFDTNSLILPCYPYGAGISELSAVAVSNAAGATTVAGRLAVIAASGIGDGCAVALKASSAAGVPLRIPILFYGAVKLTMDAAVTVGKFIVNTAAPTVYADVGTLHYDHLVVGNGASYILGLALQGGGAVSDELLVLVGKTA
jgi:hypothetical protein